MPLLLARIELFLAFFLSHLAFISYKATFWVDCSAVFGPFWGSTVSLIVKFHNFSLVVLCMKKNMSQSMSVLFWPFFCTSLIGDGESLYGCLHEYNHACASKKGMFWVHFLHILVDEYWQPIPNSDSHLFLSFFQQIQSYWFQEVLPKRMTSALIVIITHFVFFGQEPPLLFTEVAAEVTFFIVAWLLLGYGWCCDIPEHQKRCSRNRII